MKKVLAVLLILVGLTGPALATECPGGASRESLASYIKEHEVRVLADIKGVEARKVDKQIRVGQKPLVDEMVVVADEDGDPYGLGFLKGCLIAKGSLARHLDVIAKYLNGV